MARSAERHVEERREDPKNAADKVPVERNTEHVRAAAVVPCSQHFACARTQHGDGGTNRLSLGAHSYYDVSVALCPLTCGIADGIFPDCQPIPPYNHGSGIRV